MSQYQELVEISKKMMREMKQTLNAPDGEIEQVWLDATLMQLIDDCGFKYTSAMLRQFADQVDEMKRQHEMLMKEPAGRA